MCAIVGVAVDANAAGYARLILSTTQHRGEDAVGIAVHKPDQNLAKFRSEGMVKTVLTTAVMEGLPGDVALGQVRYPTNGAKEGHAVPFIDKDINLAHTENGNLPLTKPLRDYLEKHKVDTKNKNDLELQGLAIAQAVRGGLELPDAIEKIYPMFRGGFSCITSQGDTMVAYRDAKGIRPLAIGKLNNGIVVSSETCGLDAVGAKFIREVAPGEMVIITKNGFTSRQLAKGSEKLDIFEFVYIARHDSFLYGQRVNEVRHRFGEQLAQEQPPQFGDAKSIRVLPVPDTSIPAAEAYAEALGLRTKTSIIKQRYSKRSFLLADQKLRKAELASKHVVMPEGLRNMDLIVVDDSAVRFNTLPNLIRKLQAAKPKSITVLLASPPIRYPDYYGVDTADQKDLPASYETTEQLRERIGCDYLSFLSLEGMVKATGAPASRFNLSAFNGVYPIYIGKQRRSQIQKPTSTEFAT